MTGDVIATKLGDLIDRIGAEKISAVISDSGSNMIVSFGQFPLLTNTIMQYITVQYA